MKTATWLGYELNGGAFSRLAFWVSRSTVKMIPRSIAL